VKLAIVAHEKGWRLVLVSFSNLPSVANSNNAGNCLHDSSRPIEFTFDRKAPISTAAFPISLKDTKVIQNQMNNVVCYQNEDDLTTSVYDSVCWKIAQDGTSNVDNSLNELEESQLDHGRLSKSLISLAYKFNVFKLFICLLLWKEAATIWRLITLLRTSITTQGI
jgi:hypothetical protein